MWVRYVGEDAGELTRNAAEEHQWNARQRHCQQSEAYVVYDMSTKQTNVFLAPFTLILAVRTGDGDGEPADGLGALDVAHAQALTDLDRTCDLTTQRYLTASKHTTTLYCLNVMVGGRR